MKLPKRETEFKNNLKQSIKDEESKIIEPVSEDFNADTIPSNVGLIDDLVQYCSENAWDEFKFDLHGRLLEKSKSVYFAKLLDTLGSLTVRTSETGRFV